VSEYERPRPLAREDRTGEFGCGTPELDEWLDRHAWTAAAVGSARTFVSVSGVRVAGYYALAAGSVERSAAAGRLGRGMPGHPVPVVVLARLAVDLRDQGAGVGRGLLRDAMLRTLTAAESFGVRALIVHARDAPAAAFYERHGFEASPTDALHRILLMKDLRASFGDSRGGQDTRPRAHRASLRTATVRTPPRPQAAGAPSGAAAACMAFPSRAAASVQRPEAFLRAERSQPGTPNTSTDARSS
jgi:GNAT superfamily N-acetyltransferase